MSTYSDPNSSVDSQEDPGIHPDMIKSMEETRKLGDYTHAVNEYNRREETRQDLAQQQRGLELENPHSAKDPSEYGFGENLTELKNAVVGGFRDTALATNHVLLKLVMFGLVTIHLNLFLTC